MRQSGRLKNLITKLNFDIMFRQVMAPRYHKHPGNETVILKYEEKFENIVYRPYIA